MTKTLKLITSFVLLACMTGAIARDAKSYEQEWIDAAQPILELAQSMHVPLKLVLENEPDPKYSLVFMQYASDNVCQFVVNVSAQDSTQVFLGARTAGETRRRSAMIATWAHEFAHCLRLQANPTQPLVGPGAEQSTQEEGFADVFALAWVAQNKPVHFATVSSMFFKMRSDLNAHGENKRYSPEWVRNTDAIEALAKTASPYEVASKLVYGQSTAWKQGPAADVAQTASVTQNR